MKQSSKLITISGTGYNEVTFANSSDKFLVKNFGTHDILVSFDNTVADTAATKIAASHYQVMNAVEPIVGGFSRGAEKIYIKGTASDTVEVDQIWE